MCWDEYLLWSGGKEVSTLCQVGNLQRMFWMEERLRTCVAAKMAGASAIVTGTLVEEESEVEKRIREIVDAISD